MNCKNCGFSVEDGKNFCPNCGTPMEAQATNQTAEPSPIAEPNPNVMPSVTPDAPQPQAPNPAQAPQNNEAIPPQSMSAGTTGSENSNFGAVPNSGAVPPMQGDVPYDPTAMPYPPMGQPPKKKKKKVWLIVLLILIPIVLILAVFGTLFGIGWNMGMRSAEMTDAYLAARADCDADAMAEQVPDDFWTYLSDTYDADKEVVVAAMQESMDDYAESLGGDLSYDWDTKGTAFGFGSSDTLDEVREYTDEYGVEITAGVCADVSYTFTGADSSTEDSVAVWNIKSDGEWYNLAAMINFADLCETDYVKLAQYKAEFGDIAQSYWNAIADADASAMSALVPSGWWDLLDTEYNLSQSDAEDCMTQFLQEASAYYFDEDSPSVVVEVTGATAYEEDELDDLNAGLDTYDIAGDAAMDVDIAVTIGEETTDSIITMTRIDGSWYVYDAMYYYATACYEASAVPTV